MLTPQVSQCVGDWEKCAGFQSRILKSELLCPGGKSQYWPLTFEGSRGQQTSHHPLPSTGISGAICVFAQELRQTGKLRRKSKLFLECFLSGLGLPSEQ